MRAILTLLAASLALAACGAPANQTGAAFTASGQIIALGGGEAGAANACIVCHGANGEGDGDTSPRLAGLTAGYIEKQLGDYASGLRPDKVMAPIAKQLAIRDRQLVAGYYAALSSPPRAVADLPMPAIYRDGGCAACHGVEGEGVGPGNPALAGQSAAYLRDQLWRFKRAQRRNDPRGVMTSAAGPLTVAQIDEMAEWLSTRSPALPPSTGVEMLSAAQAEAARWAPSREAHRSAQ